MSQSFKKPSSKIDRALGLLGGVVFAFAASVASFYVCTVFRCHIVWFVGAAVVFGLLFSALGLFLPRYFTCFLFPVFTFFANPGGHEHCDDGHSWKVWVAGISLLLGLIALLVGALFQIHIAFATGAILFFGYALFAPKVFSDGRG